MRGYGVWVCALMRRAAKTINITLPPRCYIAGTPKFAEDLTQKALEEMLQSLGVFTNYMCCAVCVCVCVGVCSVYS